MYCLLLDSCTFELHHYRYQHIYNHQAAGKSIELFFVYKTTTKTKIMINLQIINKIDKQNKII